MTVVRRVNDPNILPLVDNRRFHAEVKQAEMAGEISVAHKFRDRNPFVRNGWSYGEALGHWLLNEARMFERTDLCLTDHGHPRNRLMPARKNLHVVDVGGGLGDVIHGVLTAFIANGRKPTCTSVDLSPKLLAQQKERLAEFEFRRSFVLGNAEKLDRLVKPADLVVVNEVVGDFRTITNIPLERDGNPTGYSDEETVQRAMKSPTCRRLWTAAWNMIEQYGLEVPGKEYADIRYGFNFAINYGAIKFFEALERTLKPGGAAFVSEHSSPYANWIGLKGHQEYTLSEAHTEQVLNRLRLDWMPGSMDEYLQLDTEVKMVDLSYANACAVLGHEKALNLDMPEMRGEVLRELREAKARMRPEDIPPAFETAMTPQQFIEELRKIDPKKADEVDNPLTAYDPTRKFRCYLIRKPSAKELTERERKRREEMYPELEALKRLVY